MSDSEILSYSALDAAVRAYFVPSPEGMAMRDRVIRSLRFYSEERLAFREIEDAVAKPVLYLTDREIILFSQTRLKKLRDSYGTD